jgi:ATP-binding protein involved in chromosome partitioning
VPSKDQVLTVLSAIKDPDLGRDVVSLGMIKDIAITDAGRVSFTFELTTPACPVRDRFQALARDLVAGIPGVTAVDLKMTANVRAPFLGASREPAIPGVKHVVAVASGKGGVGKSTVAVNLALALARHGARVGLLDADVFGPSIPTMLGAPEVPASATKDSRITPAVHQGLRVISVGFFVDKGEAVVWRGPMVHRLLQQFLGDVDWGELDYLVCDLPPGTGDVQLSLSQLIPIAGAVMVTTPQEVAIVDVVKGIAMFEKVEIPILGIIENMSYYKCPACGHHDEIFSHGGGKRLAQEVGTQFFGEIPIDTRIRFGGDAGVPVIVASPDSENAQRFMDLATKAALAIAKGVLSKPKRTPRLPIIK